MKPTKKCTFSQILFSTVPGVNPLGVELAEYPPGVGPLYRWLGPGYRNSAGLPGSARLSVSSAGVR